MLSIRMVRNPTRPHPAHMLRAFLVKEIYIFFNSYFYVCLFVCLLFTFFFGGGGWYFVYRQESILTQGCKYWKYWERKNPPKQKRQPFPSLFQSLSARPCPMPDSLISFLSFRVLCPLFVEKEESDREQGSAKSPSLIRVVGVIINCSKLVVGSTQ